MSVRSESRRQFVQHAFGGFMGTALTYVLARDGFFSNNAYAAALDSPTAPRPTDFPAKAKSCIVIFNYGGVSQVDTFDPKPALNKHDGKPIPNLDSDPLLKVRAPGNLLGSTRKFQKYGQAGIDVSDLFPHVAGCVDDLAIIRGMYADSFAHGSGLLQMNTGFLRQGFPSLGSWLSYGMGTENQNLPAYVVMLDHRGGPITGPPNWGSGFMPAAFQGTQLRLTGDPILNLRPPAERSMTRQRQQLDLLADLDRLAPTSDPANTELQARIASYELAFRMQTHAPEIVDLSQESKETFNLYGVGDEKTDRFGRQCLLARRLVEKGVRFVQVYSGGGHNDENWDAHGDVNKNHELHAVETDKPIAGLINDLKRRGMLDETLIVWTTEFGRTPTAQNGKGRDHSPRGFSTWLAGGGVRGGQVYGVTDDFGYAAVDDKVHIHDFHATILHLLGIDHELLTFFHGGRDHRLTDVAGKVIERIIA